jgi:hypothetical protein
LFENGDVEVNVAFAAVVERVAVAGIEIDEARDSVGWREPRELNSCPASEWPATTGLVRRRESMTAKTSSARAIGEISGRRFARRSISSARDAVDVIERRERRRETR